MSIPPRPRPSLSRRPAAAPNRRPRVLALYGLIATVIAPLADCTRPPPAPPAHVEVAPPPAPVATAPPVIQEYGKASFYGPEFAGKKTASGKKFVPSAMTAASKTLPLGTVATVTNVENGKSAQVVITDRGPFKKGRIIDLTPKAAAKLGMVKTGVAAVKVETVAKPEGAAEQVSSK